jgi:hypothetical protein
MIYTPWDSTTGKEVFKTIVKEVFDSTQRKAVKESEKLYNMKTTEDLFERTLRIAGMPRGTSMVEGGKIPMYDPKMGGTKDYNVTEYGQGFRMSWLFKKTNKIDALSRWTKNLTMNAIETKQAELAKLWNSPTATYLGYDGLALGHATHTCLDDAASTYDNLISAAPSVSSLESIELYYDTMKDDQGTTIFINPKGSLLYFAPALRVNIWELMNGELKPQELSNTASYWNGRFEPFCYHYLTSSTAWGVAAVSDDRYDINCFTLSKADIITRDVTEYNSLDSAVMVHQSFSFGYGDPRMVVIGNT